MKEILSKHLVTVPLGSQSILSFALLCCQSGNSTFNRAKLLNVGVREALKEEDWGCIFLHDVDLLPENDHNTYTCHTQYPTHLSVAMDKFRYR